MVDDDPWLPKLEVLRGANFWYDTGVQALLVSDPAEADVHVIPNYDECPPGVKGGVTLAWAHADGSIHVYVRCLSKMGSQVSATKLRTLIAHEMGHQHGVWNHIPNECDGNETVAANGVHVCGKAVMNSSINDLQMLSPLDILAFEARDHEVSDIKGTVTTTRSALTAHSCVYTMH
jgi:hypothetical protein